MRRNTRAIGVLYGLALLSVARAGFSTDERGAIVSYWNQSGRYFVGLPETSKTQGPWAVRLTTEGSKWLFALNKARGGVNKIPVAVDPKDPTEIWLSGKIAYDRWLATEEARSLNALVGGTGPASLPPVPNPGPMPTEFSEAVGNAPPFAVAVTPKLHSVTFDDGYSVSYSDQVPMAPRYLYFRFPQGVQSMGTQLKTIPTSELTDLFQSSGIESSAARVMQAISPLEGGFDSVNTYDTGYVSVGFIQFACGSGGSGSLASVLLQMKTSSPDAFEYNFRRFGIDVSDIAILNVVDPRTGAELMGEAATQAIIDDKRLIAVFQRAGLQSREFRIAQIQVAKSMYYPGEDSLAFAGDVPLLGKVSDVFKSEAGIATLMDRKVNTGTIAPILPVLARFAKENKVREIKELAKYEQEIVKAIRFRRDFLSDKSISQPKNSSS